MSAANAYAARVEAVVAQRTRLRGPQPSDDPFRDYPPDHPILTSDSLRPLDPNLDVIASYVTPDELVVDVSGGAGRYSLPLALRRREVVNVDPSTRMLTVFDANARRAGITNVRALRADWLAVDAPRGTFALVNHVTYFARDIVAFVEKLEAAVSGRVLITVNSPPPPSWNREVFRLVHGEEEVIVPGHVEHMNVLWEMGIEPDIRMLPDPPTSPAPATTHSAAVNAAVTRIASEQWAIWPLGAELEARIRDVLETRFDDLFRETPTGYEMSWVTYGREVLMTWMSRG